MSEFKKIESQDEFNAIVKDRVERAEKTAEERVRKEFADYESIKAENENLKKKLEEASTSVKGFDEKKKEFEDRIASLENENKGFKLTNLKIKVAQEAGLPFELADRLTGEDEDAIKADAEEMAKYMSAPQVAPFGAAEPIADGKDAFTRGLSQLAKNIDLSE